MDGSRHAPRDDFRVQLRERFAHAINRLDPLVSIDLITGATARRHRRVILDDLRTRRLDAVAAPRVLDEGIDVPDANLGIVMSASRTRRQMIQRMGRILRRKRPGVAARFVIMFAKDTLEDPANRMDRDGFLDEIERISDAAGVFDADHFDELDHFLAQPGPAAVPEPSRLERFHGVVDGAIGDAVDAALGSAPFDEVVEHLAEDLGLEELYAYVSFAQAEQRPALAEAVWRQLEPRLRPTEPAGEAEVEQIAIAPYLEPELSDLPEIAQPKQQPKRLSTGEAPLAISAKGSDWQLTCTGCGATSSPVRFRWQVLEQTVECLCS